MNGGRRSADAVDLGIKAARQALAMSRYKAKELDVIIRSSISKHNRENESILTGYRRAHPGRH